MGALYTSTNKLSIFDTSLPTVKNKPPPSTWEILWEVCLKLLVKCVCGSLNLQWISCLVHPLSAVRAREVALWAQRNKRGQQLSLGRHFYSLPSDATSRERAVGHTANLKSTIISKAIILPGCWKSKWGSVMSHSKPLYCFKHCCVYFTPSHSLCKETLWDKQEAWIVAWSLPEFPNISHFGPRDEFSLQTT